MLKLFAVLNKVTKEGLIEKIFEQKLRGGWGKRISSRRSSQYKDLKVEGILACSRRSREASVAGKEWLRREDEERRLET